MSQNSYRRKSRAKIYTQDYFENYVKPYYSVLYSFVQEYYATKDREVKKEIREFLRENFDRKDIYYLRRFFKRKGHPSKWQYNPKARYKITYKRYETPNVFRVVAGRDIYKNIADIDKHFVVKTVVELIKEVYKLDRSSGVVSVFKRSRLDRVHDIFYLRNINAIAIFNTGDIVSTGFIDPRSAPQMLWYQIKKYINLVYNIMKGEMKMFGEGERYKVEFEDYVDLTDVVLERIEVHKRTNLFVIPIRSKNLRVDILGSYVCRPIKVR